jgi:hypothetical protein
MAIIIASGSNLMNQEKSGIAGAGNLKLENYLPFRIIKNKPCRNVSNDWHIIMGVKVEQV